MEKKISKNQKMYLHHFGCSQNHQKRQNSAFHLRTEKNTCTMCISICINGIWDRIYCRVVPAFIFIIYHTHYNIVFSPILFRWLFKNYYAHQERNENSHDLFFSQFWQQLLVINLFINLCIHIWHYYGLLNKPILPNIYFG